MKLKHDKLLSNFACFGFNCNLRHYTMEMLLLDKEEGTHAMYGGAVQVDPGSEQLTLRLLSTLEPKI